MRREKIEQEAQEKGYQVSFIIFEEDGYEVVLSKNKKSENTNLNFEGFAISDLYYYNDRIIVRLVPITLEEITDYVWRFAEKYVSDESSNALKIMQAVAALEQVLSSIPFEKEKDRAIAHKNCEMFCSQIF